MKYDYEWGKKPILILLLRCNQRGAVQFSKIITFRWETRNDFWMELLVQCSCSNEDQELFRFAHCNFVSNFVNSLKDIGNPSKLAYCVWNNLWVRIPFSGFYRQITKINEWFQRRADRENFCYISVRYFRQRYQLLCSISPRLPKPFSLTAKKYIHTKSIYLSPAILPTGILDMCSSTH